MMVAPDVLQAFREAVYACFTQCRDKLFAIVDALPTTWAAYPGRLVLQMHRC